MERDPTAGVASDASEVFEFSFTSPESDSFPFLLSIFFRA